MEYDGTIEYVKFLDKQVPMDSGLFYAKMKTVWPVGQREYLLFTHVVKHDEKCWL
jgi:hypothetical protein